MTTRIIISIISVIFSVIALSINISTLIRMNKVEKEYFKKHKNR